MIVEFGHFALLLALAFALVQGLVPLVGAHTGNGALMRFARPAAAIQFALVAVSYACLTAAFVQFDFSVLYVANNANSELPLIYRIAAVWGAHEGSLVLWILMLAGWGLAVAAWSRPLPDEFAARVLGILGLLGVGFILFTVFTSNPFERLLPAAADGRDLNPLLQDPALAIHPPMLYMGYVGLSVPFAFAVAALLGGRLDAVWARWSRPWTTVAWLFLTIGITLGSWWAYYELGWGGWWFWDPVENASFLPWLVATALIHSLAVTDKRGAFKSWTVLLAIAAFALSLLGTFLVRSGVLVSVHAFATDPDRGVFLLFFFLVAVGGALLLYALRAGEMTSTARYEAVSREGFLLANNVLLCVATAVVLLGTLYPLILDALGLGKISVGPPYFNAVFVPLMLPLVLLMGFGPFARWKRTGLFDLVRRLKWPLAGSAVAAVVLPLALEGRTSWLLSVALMVAFWAMWTAILDPVQRWRKLRGEGRRLPRSALGMAFAHFGIGIFIIGVAVDTSFGVERNLRVEAGDHFEVHGYTYRFDGVRMVRGPNWDAVEGVFEVTRDGRPVTILLPQKRVYRVQQDPMTQVALMPGLFRDLYLVLGEPLGDGAWSARVNYHPFIRWIWLGALLMAAGGVLAASDRRYRLRPHRAA
ncbi:MAG: heme lyase CcmF/NrfE family subunit [Xanthomonadaceae bacterium]|nr:heme lyase CcmF/NrfE family subunit [Xanthomonadaceae bacterium]